LGSSISVHHWHFDTIDTAIGTAILELERFLVCVVIPSRPSPI